MAFRFNFTGPPDESENTKETVLKHVKYLESEKIIPSKQTSTLVDLIKHAKMFTCGDLEIGHIEASDALANMDEINSEMPLQLAEEKHSDLIAGKYEGGLKIWECTYDLIEYLIKHEEDIHFKDAKVLDLGCGAGILGIYAFLKDALVTFQDYNKEVIEFVTIPNVLLNIEEEERENLIKRCDFYSGDWGSFNEKLDKEVVYDLILTSETIYNDMNYDKLVQLFSKRLHNEGVIYMSAKTCYFGIGGGARQFEEAIRKSGLFNCIVCWKNSDGIQREILKITKKL